MAAGNSMRILSVYPSRRTAREAADQVESAGVAPVLGSSNDQQDLDQAFQLVEEIRGIFETRQTYVLHTLLDLVAIEIRLLQKEQGGQYCHSARDVREAFAVTRK
jgi:hypothetical protein